MGLYSGIFFGIFQTSLIVGNLLAGLLIQIGLPQWITWLILGGFGTCGIIIMLFMRSVEQLDVKQKVFLL